MEQRLRTPLPSSRAEWFKAPDPMPEDASPAQAVLQALGFALLAREESGALRLLGEAPAWLLQLWPKLKEDGTLPLADAG